MTGTVEAQSLRLPDPPGEPQPVDNAREKPIATGNAEAAQKLRQWWEAGEAAGNLDDFYDNRDRGHSHLRLGEHPQLGRIVYSEPEKKQRRDWALFAGVRPVTVIGNSSTSAPWQRDGSNPRRAYVTPGGLTRLHLQYRNRNLYIYPGHHDYGRAGNNADLFPTNSPYLVISRGSSGSDRTFLSAAAWTLAAFRPEVKQKLRDTGLLMPTFQMILRSTGKQLDNPEDYFTGKAHPTLFTGSNLDHLAMVEKAHAIRADEIPALPFLRVVAEDLAQPGVDYFDNEQRSEKLADTPGCVARVWRSHQRTRTYTLSAGGSADANQRPLTYRWAILRGDPDRITLQPTDETGATVELTVEHHPRRPIADEPGVVTDRIDIGLFVHNGAHWSAPAFFTVTSVPNELRTYEGDRLIELGRGAGETTVNVSKPLELAELLENASDNAPPRVAWLRGMLGDDADETLGAALAAHADARREHAEIEAEHNDAQNLVKSAELAIESLRERTENEPNDEGLEAQLTQAKELLQQRQKDLRSLRNRVRDAEQQRAKTLHPVTQPIERQLRASVSRIDFAPRHRELLAELHEAADEKHRRAYRDARQRLVSDGLLEDAEGLRFDFRSVRGNDQPFAESATKFERMLGEQFNARVVAALVGRGVLEAKFTAIYVDPRIA
ncbi:MAG: hypothetical protein ACOC3G_01300, partial [Phycisphaeraceae bacterium]